MSIVDVIIVIVALAIIGLGIGYQMRKRKRNKEAGTPNCGGCGGCNLSGDCPSQDQSTSSKNSGCCS